MARFNLVRRGSSGGCVSLRGQQLLVFMLMLPLAAPFSLTPAVELRRAAGKATATPTLPLRRIQRGRPCWTAQAAGEDGGVGNDEGWKKFRAMLIQQEKAWAAPGETERAHEPGAHIAQGSVLLGTSEPTPGCGLQQQHLHKSVVMILSHTESFTHGVILNRPTNRRTKKGWRIGYGGDVRGITTSAHMQKAVCLHRSSIGALVDASETVVKGLHACSLEQAERAVEQGHAVAHDFWLLVGFCGWGPGQLQEEIGFQDWHVSTASASVLNDLLTHAAASEPAEAGIATWERMMADAGLQRQARASAGSFADRMLREWAHMFLRHATTDPTLIPSEAMDQVLRRASRAQPRAVRATRPGTLLRTSAASPYILEQQLLHKALLLVLHDTPVLFSLPHPAETIYYVAPSPKTI